MTPTLSYIGIELSKKKPKAKVLGARPGLITVSGFI